MVSRASSTNTECTSDLPIWIALACSALALVVFFSWITTSEPALLSLYQGKNLRVQPSSETLPASDSLNDPVSAIELAESQTSSRVLLGDESTVNGDDEHSKQQDSSTPELTTESAKQSELRDAAQTTGVSHESRQLSTVQSGQLRQAVKEKAAERASHQQRETEYAASTAIVAKREPVKEEVGDAKARLMRALPGLSDGSDRPASSTAQSNEPEQGTENSENSALGHPELQSADLSALRQLLAEATAITDDEDEQVRATRERREIMESLGKLSAALSFALGSKVVNEAMTPVIRQIKRILADYPETRISVIVATNENAGDKQNVLLSQERGRALIARLVNEGLAFSRFSLEALSDEQLPANSHRVVIQAHSES